MSSPISRQQAPKCSCLPKDEILSALLQLKPASGYSSMQIWLQTLLNLLVPRQISPSWQHWTKAPGVNANSSSEHFLWAALSSLDISVTQPGLVLWDLSTIRLSGVSATRRSQGSCDRNQAKHILRFLNQHPRASTWGLGAALSPGSIVMHPAGPLPSRASGHRDTSEDYPAPRVHKALWGHWAGVSDCRTQACV